MLLRKTIGRALELAPTDVMREVVEEAERFGRIEKRVSRRMIFAVATPVVFLAVGSALIVSAHLRRADERNREETAAPSRAPCSSRCRRLARSAISTGRSSATFLGFSAYLTEVPREYGLSRSRTAS